MSKVDSHMVLISLHVIHLLKFFGYCRDLRVMTVNHTSLVSSDSCRIGQVFICCIHCLTVFVPIARAATQGTQDPCQCEVCQQIWQEGIAL